MDFDEHEETEEEMGLPVGSSYDAPTPNSPPGGGGDGGGGDGGGEGEEGMGSGRRKAGGGGGRYRECLKNHALGIGGHAVDGCGEFLAAGEEGSLDALRCAACNCHRNFHRREAGGTGGGVVGYYHHQFSPFYRTAAPGYLHHQQPLAVAAPPPHPQRHHLALIPSTSRGDREAELGMEDPYSAAAMMGMGPSSAGSHGGGRKRFRTKFTQEQKDKMLAFAERVGWRIQKEDEAAVQQLCDETSIKRHVLKVWMHNNKHTLGKNKPT
ncbi:zinc-finger homeodomain protein 2-like [Zingiber officinale]|uniref:ZF-HD dimerization-type domain-containing protein n=1 Tax=Zingiber officinale TaxID=94328 RepID=A0A8J5GFQ6_ZINOF|nr:zinc-finger homeodomain protein 2-like [Zingiber officinale]KAG6505591.1 hypothetical protein ZIOFF_037956 [Zingiber officinale]